MWRQEKERGKKRTLLLCYNYYYYYHRFLSNFVESYCCAYLIFTTFITTRLTWSKQFVDCCLMLMQRGYTIFCYSGYSVLLLPWTEQGRLDASLSSRKPFVETVWERWLSLLPTTSCICRKTYQPKLKIEIFLIPGQMGALTSAANRQLAVNAKLFTCTTKNILFLYTTRILLLLLLLLLTIIFSMYTAFESYPK